MPQLEFIVIREMFSTCYPRAVLLDVALAPAVNLFELLVKYDSTIRIG